jgi:hypothetical protein
VRTDGNVQRHVRRGVHPGPHDLAEPLGPLSYLPERRGRALDRPDGATGQPERGADQALHPLGDELYVGRLRRGDPPVGLLGVGGHGGEVEQDRRDVHARHAVHECVVRLRYQREAPAVEAVRDPDLPQRLRAVEALREDAAGELAQLVVAARLRLKFGSSTQKGRPASSGGKASFCR